MVLVSSPQRVIQGINLGDRFRPVVDAEFAIDIAGMELDRVQREEGPGSDFWMGGIVLALAGLGLTRSFCVTVVFY
jgi:hypothetical protein